MTPEDLSKLSDEELLQTMNSNKPSPMIDAFFIGFLIGIIIYGVTVNGWGFALLIPLFLIRQMLKKPKQYQALQNELKARNL